jgi:signal transduction histidine kinase/ligand-binding sensor domain-containing protein
MRSAMLRIAILLAGLGWAAPALGQYQFDSWTTNEGMPQNSVQAILQSRDGYLWLTTFDGLVRFDGMRFTVFNRANTPGIKSNRFTAIYEDDAGILWIGTENGVITRFDGLAFESFTLEGPGSGLIRGLTGDETGRLWVMGDDQILEWHDGRVQSIASGFSRVPNMRTGIYDRNGRSGFWSQDESGLKLFARGTITHWTESDGVPGAVHAVAEDSRGTLWVAGSAGVSRREGGRFVLHDRAAACGPGRSQFAFSPQMTLLCFDGRSNLLMIRLETGEQISLGPSPAGLSANLTGAAFYEDREGNLWIGTSAEGLYRARKQAITAYSQDQGLRDRNIYPVYQDHRGAIWLGAWLRTLTRLENGKVTNYSTEVGLGEGPITALFEDRDGRLWVGAYGNGLRVRERDRFIVPPGLENLGIVKAIHQDRRGAMWFGTQDKLVRVVDGELTTYTARDGMAGSDVQVIVEGSGGEIWIGGARGLTRFKDGVFRGYTEKDGLPSDHVRSLYEDADGVLWIGTYDGGMARFKDDRFTRYTTREGLFDNGAFQILEDSRGNLWMSCNRGIYRVSKQEMTDVAEGRLRTVTSVSYGTSDGMRSVEANGGSWPAGIKARDGTLWFPTQDGVVMIDAENVPRAAEAPPVRIEACRVDLTPVSVHAPVRLEPGSQNLEIEYTALTFINSAKVRFKYKLQGLDEDWVDAGPRRTAYYSSLPPGSYTFMVVAANSDGVWSTTGSTLPLVVLPPFYRTWWFMALAMAALAALVVVVGKRRETRLKRAHAAQQAFSRQLIASQEAERKRIAAELHDSIGQSLIIIKNLATLVSGMSTDGGRARAEEISTEASQAIAEVREIAQNLRPHHLDRIGLTKALEALVRKAAGASPIAFTADMDPLDGVFPKDAEINVYRVVQEGVNNILKHSQATEASVIARRSPSQVLLTMHDNGRGFMAPPRGSRAGDTAVAAMGNDLSEPAGFGLTGIVERVTLLGGRADVRSAPGQGTTISVQFDIVGDRHAH